MTWPDAPRLETRRAKELEAELVERARAWNPRWDLQDDQRDFGRALLRVAARFGSEVAERLDRAGDKLRLGFLDWLAVPTEAARPARLPVVFKLADSATDAVLATAPTRLQVTAGGASVMLETEKDVLVLPKQLQILVAVDEGGDAFYLPPPGLSSLAKLEPLATRWRLKSFASAGASQIQLDPEQGLVTAMLIELGGRDYRIKDVSKDIVTLEPPLTAAAAEGAVATKVAAFAPFDGASRNQQEHMLYLGHKELFDIEAPATLEIVGARSMTGVRWEYWGKKDQGAVAWQELPLAPETEQAKSEGLVLGKPKGSMEILELVKGVESRWIRASLGSITSGAPPFRVDAFEIRVNCRHDAALPPEAPQPRAEAMSNATPLVLDSVFFPFGREPRQFDAFYLGSQEAFSKKGAKIDLHFDLADTTFSTLSAVRSGDFAGRALVGVAQDGALHLLEVNPVTGVLGKLRNREPQRPPTADAGASSGIALNARPHGRLPVWNDPSDPNGFVVAMGAQDAVWIWSEKSDDPDAKAWQQFGTVPATSAAPTALIADLIFLPDISTLFALRGGQLSTRAWPAGSEWTPIKTKDGATTIEFDAIVPVLKESSGVLVASATEGMIGVANDGTLYRVDVAGNCISLPLTDVDASVRPVAVRQGATRIIALARTAAPHLVTFRSPSDEKAVPLEPASARATGLEAVLSGGSLYFLALVNSEHGSSLASWTPQTSTTDIEVLQAPLPAGSASAAGAPITAGSRVVAPVDGGALLISSFDLSQRKHGHAFISDAVFTTGPAPLFEPGDYLAREINDHEFSVRKIIEVGMTLDGQVYYLLVAPFALSGKGVVYGFQRTEPAFGGVSDPVAATLDLPGVDNSTDDGSVVLTSADTAHRVVSVNSSKVATLNPAPPPPAGNLDYWTSTPVSGRVSPYMKLTFPHNDWNAALLAHATLVFPGASPGQRGRAFAMESATRPLLIELTQRWDVAPAGDEFLLDAVTAGWTSVLGDTSTNPELSWEYWNGGGWWKLRINRDSTLNLKNSGHMEFVVPFDMSPTDWSGRVNYWIRARLIGGDYGREKVSVKMSLPAADGSTEQTVVRSTEDIRAPSVVKLGIFYAICENVLPEYVYSKDSGSLRDQSDANRMPGAQVEAFLPVGVLLGRLSGAPAPAVAEAPRQQDCQCPGSVPDTADAGANVPVSATGNARRSLYLGFDAPLLGEPINVLLLVEERLHDLFAPMSVEALVADRFVPITPGDATRALGESGILSIALPIEVTPRELFGRTLRWLRLSPPAGIDTSGWKPKLLGAYLNGSWASAAETLTRELVGSSQGEPNLKLYLARPPVLRNTLELRVKEPLGEEERDALNVRQGRVVSVVENLPGDWVLWDRVIDPADEAPAARVYAFDEATGEIRFGDGRHGRIPPVGRDSIMAFTYRRSEPGAPGSTEVPANSITARTPLSLVSPVEGVEAVFAADRAAGGAPPEDTDRVLRFGVASLRHRERAMTARDIEDLVLESSPDIAQARCFPRQGFVQLAVVMRGTNPIPTAAQVRELQRLLLTKAQPALSARRALRIVPPTLRRLRVDLHLRVASLDEAGAVARDTRKQLAIYFDTAAGGAGGTGWALGENPAEGDIACALANVPLLEGIATVSLREVGDNGADQPWPATLKRFDLARLGQDGVRIEFETIGELA